MINFWEIFLESLQCIPRAIHLKCSDRNIFKNSEPSNHTQKKNLTGWSEYPSNIGIYRDSCSSLAFWLQKSELAVKVIFRLRVRNTSLLDYRKGESFQLTAQCMEGYYVLPSKTSELIHYLQDDILPFLQTLTLQFFPLYLGTKRVQMLVRWATVVSNSCSSLTLLALIYKNIHMHTHAYI